MPIFGSTSREEDRAREQEQAQHSRRAGGSSPGRPHPWILSPRQPTSPMDTAASTCQHVPKHTTSHATAQAEPSTVV